MRIGSRWTLFATVILFSFGCEDPNPTGVVERSAPAIEAPVFDATTALFPCSASDTYLCPLETLTGPTSTSIPAGGATPKSAFLAPGPAATASAIVTGPALDRNDNLLVNGSFEEGHPGVGGLPDYAYVEPDARFWAPTTSGLHKPGYGTVDITGYEVTPPGWSATGSGRNYARWGGNIPEQWIDYCALFGLFCDDTRNPVYLGETGLAGSILVPHGDFEVYFGNFYLASIDRLPTEIAADGEWVFDGDPQFTYRSRSGLGWDPGVRLSQQVGGLCTGATYRASFTALGEFASPAYQAFGAAANALFGRPYNPVADGMFGLQIGGGPMKYLTIPGGHDIDIFSNSSPFGTAGAHTYTVEFTAPAADVDITFVNFGHFNSSTAGWTTRPAGVAQNTELVLDDVILNGPDCGAGTPGYWKNYPEAWPVDEITIGGVVYSKEQAIALMEDNDSQDVTYILFRSLVAAKLNVLLGNDSSCVGDVLAAADTWMADNPVGSDVRARGRDSAWRYGEPLYLTLDDYNNGLLCATARR